MVTVSERPGKRLRTWAKRNYFTRLIFLLPRLHLALGYVLPTLGRILRWLFTSNEATNLTYPLSTQGEAYLVHALADVLDVSVAEISAYVDEAKSDSDLRTHILAAYRAAPNWRLADQRVDFGRRLGWYAIVRQRKPKLVVETGVEKGLGAALLCAALLRNEAEGFPGT